MEIIDEINITTKLSGINNKTYLSKGKELEASNESKTVALKPLFRGFIHFGAFICTLVTLILFIITSIYYRFNWGVFIHLISQLIQFGASAVYHIPNWSPKIKTVLRFIDHICIPILVSGTQTSVLLNSIDKISAQHMVAIKITWVISILFIARMLLYRKLHDIFDLCCHIVHGMIVIPYLKLFKNLSYLGSSTSLVWRTAVFGRWCCLWNGMAESSSKSIWFP